MQRIKSSYLYTALIDSFWPTTDLHVLAAYKFWSIFESFSFDGVSQKYIFTFTPKPDDFFLDPANKTKSITPFDYTKYLPPDFPVVSAGVTINRAVCPELEVMMYTTGVTENDRKLALLLGMDTENPVSINGKRFTTMV